MKIRIEYDGKEAAAIIKAAHVARFGNAPDGQEWVVESSYSGRFDVTNREIETPETDKVTE